MLSLLDFIHFGRGVPGWGPTRAHRSWVQSVKPLRYLLWKGVVSVWPEGTLGHTSPLRIRQTCPIFFHVLLWPSRARTQKIIPFRVRMHFLPFSRQKTQKILPGRDATCVCCRISFILAVGARVGPHTRSQKLGAIRQTAQVLAVEGGGFGMAGGDPRSHLSASHPPNVPNFFPRATVP